MGNTVVLTGAGATIPWNGPTTRDITDSLCQDRTFLTRTGRTVAQYLREHLENYYRLDPESVTFETIIDLVEELHQYLASQDTMGFHEFKSPTPVILAVQPTIANDVLPSRGCATDFLRSVYFHFLDHVIGRVCVYSQGVTGHSLNTALSEFVQHITKRSVLRHYTTNYDRLFIDANPHISLFDGFQGNGAGTRSIDRDRIALRANEHCHLNLHGSIYWNLRVMEWVTTPGQVHMSPQGASQDHSQSGAPHLRTNILTGLNKPARILFSPFSEFYHSFYNDCLNTDLLFVVGYAFGDWHIDKAIQDRVLLQRNVKVVVITYIQAWVDALVRGSFPDPWSDQWTHLQNSFQDEFEERVDDTGWIVSKNGKYEVYWKGFEKFLRDQEWSRF